ncbi:sulfatase-like hydrolase/transferase [Alphaproteobacteria bacterium]|nr:sulfatase-like hydrolase/transferase [bacterium]MDC0147386.1 sulfatase-like hydrolase/transferase [Alphaproteobacteria bacterium]
MKRKTLIVVLLLLGLVAVGYTQRVNIIVGVIGVVFKMGQGVGPNQEVTWQATDEAKNPSDRKDGPPNIIVILTDDMGFNDVSFYGGGMVDTPHIDKLASQGVNFRNGYAGSSVCSISRAAILTGRYATRFGFEFTPAPDPFATILKVLASETKGVRKMHFPEIAENHPLPYAQKGMPSREVTIAEYLKQADYRTLHIGKWHLGRSPEFLPNAQGFDDSLLMESGLYLPEDDPNVVNSKQSFDPIDRILWTILTYAASFNGGERFAPKSYLTDYYAEEAVKAIEANKDRPFFMYLAHWGIHTPLQAKKQDYDALADDIPDHRSRVYGAMIRAVDRSVGAVMQALKDNGLDENTLVIFTSDNGGADYVGLPNINKPYRGWKLTFYEGGTHVPFFMRWPGRLPAGETFTHPVSHLDILPTALGAAGIELEPRLAERDLDGVNLLPYVRGQKTEAPHDVLVWREGHYQAILANGWKLQVSEHPKMSRLYRLVDDPTEQIDLEKRHPEKVAELKALLALHNGGQADPMWTHQVEIPIVIDKTLEQPATHDDEHIYWPN